jgi:hypothetical protein
MVQDEKSDVLQVGAAAAESPTLLPQCGSAALGVGLFASPFLQQLASTAWGFRQARSVAVRPFAARPFLRTPMRRHAHAASDRGTNRIA